MPTPVTPEMFTSRGVPAEQAAAMAAEHNSLAGIRTETAVAPAPPRAVPAPSPPVGTTAEQARAEIDKIRAERASGNIDDRAWKRQYEPRILELSGVASTLKDYRAASGADKSVLLAEMAAGQEQAKFEASVDAAAAPKSPSEYSFPENPATPESAKVDTEMRQAMFSAGIPREMGNSIAVEVEATAKVLGSGDVAQIDAYMADQESALRRIFGSQYEARLEMTQSFLRQHAANSPTLKALLTHKPELFSSWQVVQALSQLAESKKRASKGATQ